MRLEFPAPPLTRKRERALRYAARRLAPLARLREGQGERACQELPTVSYSYEMLNNSLTVNLMMLDPPNLKRVARLSRLFAGQVLPKLPPQAPCAQECRGV